MSAVTFRLPAYFKDNMILQQGVTNRIFGQTKSDSEIRVVLERYPGISAESKIEKDSQTGEAVIAKKSEYGIVYQSKEETDAKGYFSFKLPVIEASFDHYRLSLTVGNRRCLIKNIYFGEVWLALGESNMSMPARYTDVKDLVPLIAKQKYLRIFTMSEFALEKDEDRYLYNPTARIVGGKWLIPDESNIADISATALTFGARLQENLNIPVAIYNLAASDTMLHSWLPREIIESNEVIKNHIKTIKFYRDQNDWNDIPDLEKNSIRTINLNLEQDPAAQLPAFTRKNQPAVMFNHKLAPFSDLSIRGVLFSQGESDVQFPEYYLEAFKAFSEMLTQKFHSFKRGPCLIYSQLPPYFYSSWDDKRLAYFNEILTIARRQLKTPAGMITLYDLPLDYNKKSKDQENNPEFQRYSRPLNPIAKAKVGERMSMIAKGMVYHADTPKSAPEVKYAEWISDKLILSFANIGEGLMLPEGDLTLKGFNICDENSHYFPAQANKLYGIRTLVWHPEIKEPKSCSYAFSSFNQEANLLGGNGMPVVPFRLERDYPDNSLRNAWMYCDKLTSWVVPKRNVNYSEMSQKDLPGYFPLWKISEGKGKLSLEKNNKRSSSAALFLQYFKADENPIIFEPILDYASLYPPMDLSYWHNLSIEVFNADHHKKQIFLYLTDEDGQEARSIPLRINDVLAWQKISFIIDEMSVDLSRIKCLRFMLKSDYPDGDLTIDSVAGEGRKDFK